MARRSIAKTAIEGGRSHRNRYAEKEEDRKERARIRVYCGNARFDSEIDEPSNNARNGYEIGVQYREFLDKLSPVKRWLEAQVNRPWDNILSDVVKKFDASTLAGRHILGHVKGFVILPNAPYRLGRIRNLFPGDLFVDTDGILRQEKKIARKKYYSL